jgi:uncharacterized membrane protein
LSWIFDGEVLAVLAAIVLVSSIFAFVQVVNVGRVVEPFSELGILGPDMKIGGYPREVASGVAFKLYLYVGNHEGRTMYYRVLVKVGDRSSHINNTVPLEAPPILEYRVVLQHNSTTVIPINVTLWKPGLNLRLVFEMWIYNETLRDFTYYGRWNQLWLNVTGPAAQTASEKPILYPKDYDDRLSQAFLSIRRAESSGGNVTVMVSLLNEALEYALKGDSVEVEKIVEEILSLESKVSSEGLESRNRQIYYTVACAGLSVGFSATAFYLLKERVFLYWSKLRAKWIVYPASKSKNRNREDASEEKLTDIIQSKKNISVEALIGECRRLGLDAKSSAKTLFKMLRRGSVRLEDPNPPKTFKSFMLSTYSLGFWTTSSIVALTITSVYTPPLTFVRYVLGSMFVLFIPGYSLIEALYPRESDLTPLERLALSIGLSLALVPLVGLILNYTPWGIRLNPIIISLTLLTLSLLTTSYYRKFSLLKLSLEGRA